MEENKSNFDFSLLRMNRNYPKCDFKSKSNSHSGKWLQIKTDKIMNMISNLDIRSNHFKPSPILNTALKSNFFPVDKSNIHYWAYTSNEGPSGGWSSVTYINKIQLPISPVFATLIIDDRCRRINEGWKLDDEGKFMFEYTTVSLNSNNVIWTTALSYEWVLPSSRQRKVIRPITTTTYFKFWSQRPIRFNSAQVVKYRATSWVGSGAGVMTLRCLIIELLLQLMTSFFK